MGLVPLVGEGGERVVERIRRLREQIAQELGFLMPPVRVRDLPTLPLTGYEIRIRGMKVGEGEVFPSRLLAIPPSKGAISELEGIEVREPIYGAEAVWIEPSEEPKAKALNCTVIDPLTVVITHLGEAVKQNAHRLLTRQETRRLIERVREEDAAVVEELVPNLLSLGVIQKVLANLLSEGVPIKDLVTILETLADKAVETKDPVLLTEYCREALGPLIVAQYARGDVIRAILLDPELEASLGEGRELTPEVVRALSSRVGELMAKAAEKGEEVVVVCSPKVRPVLKEVLSRSGVRVPVLSYAEIPGTIKVEPVGVVRLYEG